MPISSLDTRLVPTLTTNTSTFPGSTSISAPSSNTITRTDIILSIFPKHIPHIISRAKDHEFRKYLIPTTVRRMWLYESSPVSALRYCAVVGPARLPGDFTKDELTGMRNEEFHAGELTSQKLATHAYKILELYKLEPQQSLVEMKQQGWLKGAPQRFQYVTAEMTAAVEQGLKRIF